MKKAKASLPQEITIPVLFWIDEDGTKVYDIEGMRETFEVEMERLGITEE